MFESFECFLKGSRLSSTFSLYIFCIIVIVFYLFVGNVNEDVTLISQKEICGGELSAYPRVSSVLDCASVCHGVSPVFSMAQPGSDICDRDGMCYVNHSLLWL